MVPIDPLGAGADADGEAWLASPPGAPSTRAAKTMTNANMVPAVVKAIQRASVRGMRSPWRYE